MPCFKNTISSIACFSLGTNFQLLGISCKAWYKLIYFCYWIKLGSTHQICSKANLLSLGYSEGKNHVYCKAPRMEYVTFLFKRLKLLNGFQVRVLKGNIKGVGCRVHDQLLHNLWLVGVVVTGRYFRDSITNFLVPTGLRPIYWWSTCS